MALLTTLALIAASPSPVTVAGLPAAALAGRGAETPFVTVEAEDGTSDGIPVGPDRTVGTIASEASGRRAVRLERPGQRLDLILDRPADAVTVRYAIPDSRDGKGLDAAAGVYRDGRRIATLRLTSRYSWYYGAYPFTNRPADGKPHHVFDHVRLKLGELVPAGARLSIRLEPGTAPAWAVIDLVDLERVPPPRAPPANALSVLGFGADPSGRASALRAFRAAIARARSTGRPLWVPPGEYRVDGHLRVDRVRILGAGHWHSVLRGRGVGFYGLRRPRSSQRVELSGFAIIGEVAERKDDEQLAGIGGALGNSTISDLFIQHTKVGLWLDGPLDRLTISRLRILDQAADGINFHGGVTNSIVTDSFVRNVGDDGLAMWSHRVENRSNRFSRNTIISPVLANGIAIYGGRDIVVDGNLVADAVTQGGGIHLGSRFDATPFRGDISIAGNRIVRSGTLDPNWHFGVGAFWIYALDRPIVEARIIVRDLSVRGASHAAIQFLGKRIEGAEFERVSICGTGDGAVQVQASGRAAFRDVVGRGVALPGVVTDGSAFEIIDRGGNSGWSGRGALMVPQPASPAQPAASCPP